MHQTAKNVTLTGYGISPGLALGKTYIYRDVLQRMEEVYCVAPDKVHEELRRVELAFEKICSELETNEKHVKDKLDEAFSRIFRAHREILGDSSLRTEIHDLIEHNRVNAEFAVMAVFRRLEGKFRQLDDERWAQRADDVADLTRRLLRTLTGQASHQLADLPRDTVVVASSLLPSDTVHFSRWSVSAVIVERGGPASHAAILTRELGIPAVSGVSNVIDSIAEGQTVLVDGNKGVVVLQPDDHLQEAACRRRAEMMTRQVEAAQQARARAQTWDGVEVAVMANISGLDDATLAATHGADGIGLYRIEQVYVGREDLPEEEELVETLRQTLAPFDADLSITLRLLDIGGDKTLPFLDHPKEPAPLLGRRGVRFLRAFPDLLRTQLRAFLRLSRERSVRILVPMVTLASDMEAVRNSYLQVADELACQSLPPLGGMVETPAAALCTERIAAYSDFFSIGTNDLTQYTMAAGRENTHVEDYFVQDHPAVFRLLENIVQAAGNRPVGVCGELASETRATGLLLALGIRELSVNPVQVPHVKQAVRGTDLQSTDTPVAIGPSR